MIDRAPRNRLPADRQERVDPRRHDLGRVRILTIEGAVGERAGRYVEIPRSRAPERFAHILKPVSCAGGNGPPRFNARGRADELDVRRAGLFSRLDRRDPQPRHRPLMHRHNFDRVALTPLPQDILCGSREPVVPAPRGVGRRWQRRADGEPSLGGQRGPKSALAIDKQLREPPLSPLHLGEDGAPAWPAIDLRDRPTGNPPTTTEDGMGILGGVDDRR